MLSADYFHFSLMPLLQHAYDAMLRRHCADADDADY